MSNTYLKRKIRKYEFGKQIALIILIFCSFFAGRYFFFSGILAGIAFGIAFGAIGGIILFVIEYYIQKQSHYKKGLKLEEQIADKLDNLGIKYEPHVKTGYGDLDFFINSKINYGVEVKNWPGVVTFENGCLRVDNWDNTDILITLLKHCKLVRNIKFGENTGKFIKPVLVFGHKAVVHISQNKIMFNNVEIIVATIKDFDRYIL